MSADEIGNEVPTTPPDRRRPQTPDMMAATRPGTVYPGAAADAVDIPESVPETVIPRPTPEASGRPNRSLILWVVAVVVVIIVVAVALG